MTKDIIFKELKSLIDNSDMINKYKLIAEYFIKKHPEDVWGGITDDTVININVISSYEYLINMTNKEIFYKKSGLFVMYDIKRKTSELIGGRLQISINELYDYIIKEERLLKINSILKN